MQLTAHFTLAEFRDVSSATLDVTDIANARYFAEQILEPLRKAMGFPIKITSFKRLGLTGTHPKGEAIDFQPCRRCADGGELASGEFDRRLEAMFAWLAQHKTSAFGKLIHERNHLHATMPGAQGVTGQVLREPEEGVYQLASVMGFAWQTMDGGKKFVIGILLIGALFYFAAKARRR